MSMSHIKTFTMDPHKVELHELSLLTPAMTQPQLAALTHSIDTLGQLNPVVMYQGKLVDGRHRLLAIKELKLTQILYTNLVSTFTLTEVKEIILNGYEQRRHQSATQKAIFAYNELTASKKAGIKITQGELAEKHGIHINDMSLVKKLTKLTSQNVLDVLFNGGKIKLSNGKHTDNLRAIIAYFQTISDEATEDSFKQPLDITDDEWEMINVYTDNLAENHSSTVLTALANTLLRRARG